MQVRYVGENDPRVLITGKIYSVLSVQYGWYQIRNESGKAFMYPPSSFMRVETFGSQRARGV